MTTIQITIKQVKIYFIRLMSQSFLIKILCYTSRPFTITLVSTAVICAGRCMILKWLQLLVEEVDDLHDVEHVKISMKTLLKKWRLCKQPLPITCSTSSRTSTRSTECYNHFRIRQRPAQTIADDGSVMVKGLHV